MSFSAKRLSNENLGDFAALHCEDNDAGWCQCVAWWVPSWDGFSERSAEANRTLRQELFDRGELDGYVLYEAGTPIAWAQVGLRDRLSKLVAQFSLAPAPKTWAVTCFLTAKNARGRGAAKTLLKHIIEDLKTRGAGELEAFPKAGDKLDLLDLWNGPKSMFESAGFQGLERAAGRQRFCLVLG